MDTKDKENIIKELSSLGISLFDKIDQKSRKPTNYLNGYYKQFDSQILVIQIKILFFQFLYVHN